MELAPERPNVELRRDREGERIVVLAFPYERQLVELVRTIPHRRFDWDAREWWAPADDWAGIKVARRRRAAVDRPRADDAPRRAWMVGSRHPRRSGT